MISRESTGLSIELYKRPMGTQRAAHVSPITGCSSWYRYLKLGRLKLEIHIGLLLVRKVATGKLAIARTGTKGRRGMKPRKLIKRRSDDNVDNWTLATAQVVDNALTHRNVADESALHWHWHKPERGPHSTQRVGLDPLQSASQPQQCCPLTHLPRTCATSASWTTSKLASLAMLCRTSHCSQASCPPHHSNLPRNCHILSI